MRVFSIRGPVWWGSDVMVEGGGVCVTRVKPDPFLTSPRLHLLMLAANGEPHRRDLVPTELPIHLTLATAPRKPGDDGCQVVWLDGLWHMDLKPSQQRQVCLVFLNERG
jgi:hypothetical protein